MHKDGNGVKKDINQAIYWYKKSAEQEYQEAQDELDKLIDKKNILINFTEYNKLIEEINRGNLLKCMVILPNKILLIKIS
ncbi:hypothetical protein RhiirA4_492891 [Rhizophagus irregularis]|uniref:Uncharacterized protein n=1 Tax=Rhizophagus irregularis TaxID=588596 RepID=A0A2I1HXG4_9GLOM|nr:hypothetical protein RhiirA4_492891 [Rhizophagus irregularis]